MEYLKSRLIENKIDFDEIKVGTNITKSGISFKTLNIPVDTIDLIKATYKIDTYTVSGEKNYSEQVLRCKQLIFQPDGNFIWDLSSINTANNYIIISADEIVMNAPASIDKLASIKLISPFSKPPFNGVVPKGAKGNHGVNGFNQVNDNGQNGGHGGHGEQGNIGLTYQYPLVYIFYKSLKVNTANPTILSALSIIGEGLVGGTGGDGGDGGNGGKAGRGTPGQAEPIGGIFPIKTCTAGPGNGGYGGWAGQGGKGGQAGKGGDGVSIAFVGPDTYLSKLENIEVFNNKGKSGNVGIPGIDGIPGAAGGAGSKPPECTDGGVHGQAGSVAPNPLKGNGDTNIDGIDGQIFTVNRINTDI